MTSHVATLLKEVRLSASGGDSGGWYCQLRYGHYVCKSLSGTIPSRSEHRATLMGIVAGLRALKCPCIVRIETCNDYVFDCANRLFATRGRGSDLFVAAVRKGTAKNGDLWREFDEFRKTHSIHIERITVTEMTRRCQYARYWAEHDPRRHAT